MEQQNAGGLSSRRAKQNEEDILALIATREENGLSVKAFCERHALSAGTYYYWQKKYRNKNKAAGPKQGGFAVLQLQDAHSVLGSLSGELILPNGIRLRLYQPVTASFVQSLL